MIGAKPGQQQRAGGIELVGIARAHQVDALLQFFALDRRREPAPAPPGIVIGGSPGPWLSMRAGLSFLKSMSMSSESSGLSDLVASQALGRSVSASRVVRVRVAVARARFDHRCCRTPRSPITDAADARAAPCSASRSSGLMLRRSSSCSAVGTWAIAGSDASQQQHRRQYPQSPAHQNPCCQIAKPCTPEDESGRNGRIVVPDADADLAGAEPPRVAQFYIVEVERHVADCVVAAVAIELHPAQREAQDIAVGAGQEPAERDTSGCRCPWSGR